MKIKKKKTGPEKKKARKTEAAGPLALETRDAPASTGMEIAVRERKQPKAAKKSRKKKDTKKVQTARRSGTKNPAARQIPYEGVYPNGIIETAGHRYSKAYRLPEMNFRSLDIEKQSGIADQWRSFIDSFTPEVDIQVTIHNRTIDRETLRKRLFISRKDDGLDEFRGEYNAMLEEKMKGARNNLETVKTLVISVPAKNILEADEKFGEIDKRVAEDFANESIKEGVVPMTIYERLDDLNRIYNNVTEPLCRTRIIDGREVQSFTLENCANQGITTRDAIAPSYLEFRMLDGFVGERKAKSFFVGDFPTFVRGTLLTDFADIPENLLVSIHFHPIDQQKALNLIKNKRTDIKSLIVDREKKAAQKMVDPTLQTTDQREASDNADELLSKTSRDNTKIYTINFTITAFADDDETMNTAVEAIRAKAGKNLVGIKPLVFQQEAGLATSLPLGVNAVLNNRLITSETVEALVPFSVQEVNEPGGVYYGLNAISNNMIIYNIKEEITPSTVILGMPGGGKSFMAKKLMINTLLATGDEVYVIDPDREYRNMAKELGGDVVKLSLGSDNFINLLDLDITEDPDDEDKTDPLSVKSDFIQNILEIMIADRYGLSPIDRTIIDRAVRRVYAPYIEYLEREGKTIDTEKAPTLVDLYNEISMQESFEAQQMAVSLEKYVTGSSNIFSKTTNISMNRRFVVFDVGSIGGLKSAGLHVCLNHIWNKMIENFKKNKRTWIFLDEFHNLTTSESASAYIADIYKRARKWGGIPTAITQNVEDVLKSENARTVINNAACVILLGQTPTNRHELSRLFSISESEQAYISTSKPGMGLIRIHNHDIIPMNDDFPKDTKLYRIMSTKVGERII